ncbi:MAG: hypothetical protein JWN03_1667 [Nocardia sp.]|nr:hypothetical protein [Nocardia sp.]
MSAHQEVLSANQFGRPTNAQVAAEEDVPPTSERHGQLIFRGIELRFSRGPSVWECVFGCTHQL